MANIARAPWWQEWLENRFRPRRPGVDRNPFGGPVVAADELFGWLIAASARIQRGDTRPILRVFARGAQQPTEPALHPRRADGSIVGYIERVSRLRGETGIVLNNIQSATPSSWRLAQSLMSGLVHAAGFSPGGSVLDVFAGAYHTGFFRVHRDDQDVLTYVIEGSKRFLVWPFEVFAKHSQATADNGGQSSFVLKDIDPRAHRDTATVLEGGPGDVMYWPADHWHCAFSDSGEHATTLALGFLDDATSSVEARARPRGEASGLGRASLPGHRGRRRASRRRRAPGHGQGPGRPATPPPHRRTDPRPRHPFGYLTLPDPAPNEKVPGDAHVRVPVPGSLAFLVDGDELVWSVSGAVHSIPRTAALLALFTRLSAGDTIHVAGMLAEHDDESGAFGQVFDLLRRHHALLYV